MYYIGVTKNVSLGVQRRECCREWKFDIVCEVRVHHAVRDEICCVIVSILLFWMEFVLLRMTSCRKDERVSCLVASNSFSQSYSTINN